MDATELSLQALEQCDALFEDELMWPELRENIRPMLLQPTEGRSAYVVDEYAAGKFVIAVIAKHAANQIALGGFHVYRGILGFDGQSLRNIAEEALSYLHEIDVLSYETYQERLEEIEEAVKNAG